MAEQSAITEYSTRAVRPLGRVLFLICFLWLPATAQELQFLPEIDAHLKLNSTFRVYVEAKEDRDGSDPIQAGIGPSLQLYIKPLVKLKKVTAFDLNDAKSRFLVLEAGYRYIVTPGAPNDNRMLVAVTSNFPLKAGFFSPIETVRIWTGGTEFSPGDIATS